MPNPKNVLLTGRPGIGKTTVVEKVAERAREEGASVRGVFSPEVRGDGERVGFRITDVATGRPKVMAHVNRDDTDDGPTVGKYGVDAEAVDEIARKALVPEDADLVVVDEAAPMETRSDAFVEHVRAVLDSSTPVVAVVQESGETGFVGRAQSFRSSTSPSVLLSNVLFEDSRLAPLVTMMPYVELARSVLSVTEACESSSR